jgi:two-component system, NtrC family, sensor histidine kinase PilS
VQSVLEQRLRKLMLFRVVMITTLLLIAISVEAVSETLLPVNPLYFLIAVTYGLTLIYVVCLVQFGHHVLQARLQALLDLLLITGLVYLTGGTGNQGGFMLLYPISVLSSSVLLYRRTGLLLAGAATVMYGGMLHAVHTGLVPVWTISGSPPLTDRQIVYSVFVTGVSCTTVALIGAYLSESLRSVGQRLVEATETVADLRELHRVMVNSIHSGLMIADLKGRILYLNPFGETILGVPADQLRGGSVASLFQSPQLEPAVLGARAASDILGRLEVAYRSPAGKELDLGLSVCSLSGSELSQGYLLAFQNLTDVKRLEREVRTKEKLAAVGEMAAQLAHEIRNPLGSISGSAQVLMAEPNISEEQSRLLGIITRESRRLSDTLNQFLFQARPAPPPRGPVDLGRLVEEAVLLLRNGPEVGRHHRVEFDCDQGPHLCLGDPDQMSQVFWNLARNGLEAMTDGGLLDIQLRRAKGSVVLRIRDQGRGLSRDEQRRVFEPFQSGTRVGTGLGLAIVYRIVREHWGDIDIHSIPGQGTEVEVRFPLFTVSASA